MCVHVHRFVPACIRVDLWSRLLLPVRVVQVTSVRVWFGTRHAGTYVIGDPADIIVLVIICVIKDGWRAGLYMVLQFTPQEKERSRKIACRLRRAIRIGTATGNALGGAWRWDDEAIASRVLTSPTQSRSRTGR